MPILINGERVSFTGGGPGATPRESQSIDIQGEETSEVRLTELDQDDPKGRYRLRVEDSCLLIQRATAANWESAETLITIGTGGVVIELPEDDTGDALELLLLEVRELRQLVDLVLG